MSGPSPFPSSYCLTPKAQKHVLRNLQPSAYPDLLDGAPLTPGREIYFPPQGECEAVSLVILKVPERGPVLVGLPGEA